MSNASVKCMNIFIKHSEEELMEFVIKLASRYPESFVEAWNLVESGEIQKRMLTDDEIVNSAFEAICMVFLTEKCVIREMLCLLRENDPIAAIKYHRIQKGSSLKQAKDIMDILHKFI